MKIRRAPSAARDKFIAWATGSRAGKARGAGKAGAAEPPLSMGCEFDCQRNGAGGNRGGIGGSGSLTLPKTPAEQLGEQLPRPRLAFLGQDDGLRFAPGLADKPFFRESVHRFPVKGFPDAAALVVAEQKQGEDGVVDFVLVGFHDGLLFPFRSNSAHFEAKPVVKLLPFPADLAPKQAFWLKSNSADILWTFSRFDCLFDRKTRFGDRATGIRRDCLRAAHVIFPPRAPP